MGLYTKSVHSWAHHSLTHWPHYCFLHRFKASKAIWKSSVRKRRRKSFILDVSHQLNWHCSEYPLFKCNSATKIWEQSASLLIVFSEGNAQLTNRARMLLRDLFFEISLWLLLSAHPVWWKWYTNVLWNNWQDNLCFLRTYHVLHLVYIHLGRCANQPDIYVPPLQLPSKKQATQQRHHDD